MVQQTYTTQYTNTNSTLHKPNQTENEKKYYKIIPIFCIKSYASLSASFDDLFADWRKDGFQFL